MFSPPPSSRHLAVIHSSDHLTHAGSGILTTEGVYISHVFCLELNFTVPLADPRPFRSHLPSQLKLFDFYIRVGLQESPWAHEAAVELLRDWAVVRVWHLQATIQSQGKVALVNVRLLRFYSGPDFLIIYLITTLPYVTVVKGSWITTDLNETCLPKETLLFHCQHTERIVAQNKQVVTVSLSDITIET